MQTIARANMQENRRTNRWLAITLVKRRWWQPLWPSSLAKKQVIEAPLAIVTCKTKVKTQGIEAPLTIITCKTQVIADPLAFVPWKMQVLAALQTKINTSEIKNTKNQYATTKT